MLASQFEERRNAERRLPATLYRPGTPRGIVGELEQQDQRLG